MLRALLAPVSAPVLAFVAGLAATVPAAAGQADDLVAVLRLPEVFAGISAEGDAYGQELDDNMMDGGGGAAWQ